MFVSKYNHAYIYIYPNAVAHLPDDLGPDLGFYIIYI